MKKNKQHSAKRTQKDLIFEKQMNYFLKPFAVSQMILVVSTILAFLTLVFLLLTVMLMDERDFFFNVTLFNTLMLGLIFVLMFDTVAITLIHVTSRSNMPSYEEYKRSLNRHEYLKQRSRFPGLLDFENNRKDFTPEPKTEGLTLEKVCTHFHNYLANELKLYYTLPDLRKFITSLGVSKTMILQGMSGTGKTSIAVAFGKFINVPSTVVPIQPMWKERSDMLGYYNEFTGKFNETVILHKLYEATFSDKMHIIILDEVNIARVEYYFAEFLSLLELPPSSNRELVVAAAGAEGDPRKMKRGKIILPDNVWFLGTANNDDSTFAISDKVYDRAMIMNLETRANPFISDEKAKQIHLSTTVFYELITKAKKDYRLSDEGRRKIKELDEYLISTFQVTFGNRILMQINNYVPIFIACGGSEDEALDDILAKKTLRKLEAKNPVYVKAKSQELITKLDDIFGPEVMKDCISYVNRIVDSM